MPKRKSGPIEVPDDDGSAEAVGSGKDSDDDVAAEAVSFGRESGDEGAGDTGESGEEDLELDDDEFDEEEELHEGLSDGEEEDELHEGLSDGEDEEAGSSADEEEQEDRVNAFGRAFGKIMKKRVPQSAVTEVLGPVLAEREKLLVKKLEEEESGRKAKIKDKEEKRELREKGHVLPQTYADAKEKGLIKLATKGVVRLFNAVSKAQKVQAESDISSTKSAKATWKHSKAAFMTELRSGSKSGLKAEAGDGASGTAKLHKEEEPGWAALRSDFMLGNSKHKDWDKNLADGLPDNGVAASQ